MITTASIRYESSPIASLQGIDANARVIYIGTFSKVLFPSLRLGYIVIPPDLVDAFLAVRQAMDLGSPSFYQKVLVDFIGEGHFGRHIRRMRVLYHVRRDVLAASVGKELGIHGRSGGKRGWYASDGQSAKWSERRENCRTSLEPQASDMAVVSPLSRRGAAPWFHPGFWQHPNRGDSTLSSQASQPARSEVSPCSRLKIEDRPREFAASGLRKLAANVPGTSMVY